VTWHDFGLERDWEDPDDGALNLERYRNVGPFHFAWPQYYAAIVKRSALQDQSESRDVGACGG
jgi:hypothetical protein